MRRGGKRREWGEWGNWREWREWGQGTQQQHTAHGSSSTPEARGGVCRPCAGLVRPCAAGAALSGRVMQPSQGHALLVSTLVASRVCARMHGRVSQSAIRNT